MPVETPDVQIENPIEGNVLIHKTSEIEVISLDLFGTLVDVQQSLRPAWVTILGDRYSDVFSEQQWGRATEILRTKLTGAGLDGQPFRSVRRIFEESFHILFSETGLTFDPELAADLWVQGHKASKPYSDVEPFLRAIGPKYKLCLSSDCDAEMLSTIHDYYTFDHVFTSQKLKTYKSNPVFFEQVLEHYSVRPEKVLHIGDAIVDVAGPARIGMRTCWLNRGDRQWEYPMKPDIEVKSLTQVAGMLV